MSSKCSTSMKRGKDAHCQTSRLEIDKQSCPRALQPNVNTHTPWTSPPLGAAPNRLPPELAPWERTSAYTASTSTDLSIQLKPDTLQTKSVLKVCWAGKTFTAKLQDSRSTSSHVRDFATPREHTLPGPLLRLGLPQTGCYQSWLLTGP